MKRNTKRDKIIKGLCDIAFGRVNDTVRLLYEGDEELSEALTELDLSMLTEIKRGSNGTIELKYIDRLKAMEMLLKLTEDSERASEGSTAALIRAIESAAANTKRRDDLVD